MSIDASVEVIPRSRVLAQKLILILSILSINNCCCFFTSPLLYKTPIIIGDGIVYGDRWVFGHKKSAFVSEWFSLLGFLEGRVPVSTYLDREGDESHVILIFLSTNYFSLTGIQ